MRTTFAEEGDLRATDVLAALVALWREGATGALHFSRSGATAGFHLSAGEVTAVSSSDSRFETASILLRAGKLDAATLERLTTPEGGDRAFSALQAGILTKREWRWGEKIRAVEVLSDLLTWLEGDYVFDRGAHAEAGEFRLTVPRLVLELFLRSRDRGLVLHHLGGADVPLARAPHFDAEFAAFGLTADAEAVVRLIDGRSTAAQIASEGPAEPFAVEKLLAALVTLGLVHPEFVGADADLSGAADTGAAPAALGDAGLGGDEPGDGDAEAPENEFAETESVEDHVEEEEEAYAELDIADAPGSTGPEEPAAEAERGVGEAEPEESAVGESEISAGYGADDELSIAAERLRPGLGELESPLDRATYDRPEAGSADEGGALSETGEGDFGTPEPPRAHPAPLDLGTGVGARDRPRPRSAGPLLALLVILAVGVAGVILLRGRGTGGSRAAVPLPTPTAVSGPTGEAAVLSAEASPIPTSRLAAGAPERSTPTLAAPARSAAKAKAPVPTPAPSRPATPKPAPTRPPSKPPTPVPARAAAAPAAPAAGEAPGGTRQAWLDRAARDRQRATADRRAHFTVQVELACEIATLVDAWKYDRPAGTLWVLTTPFNGKTCFRVLWGRYPTKEATRRALSGVPPFFSSAHNRPVVTAIR